jgi:hypothetical protein
MPYFARVFATSDAVPPLDTLRILTGQYAATITTSDDETDWDTAELLYDEEEKPVDIERYLPATDGLFEEDINDFRATVESIDNESAAVVLTALEDCRQIIALRVPDDADDTVWGPLNAAVDALTSSVGGISHADNEGFYDGRELILPMD